jgi:hypothetical protein
VRQLVLVVVLVGAAFLGGAFVNGPGLRWVQTQVLGSLGLSEGGEIASVDLKGSATPDHGGDGIGPIKGTTESVQGPLAPMPSIIAEVEKGKPDSSISRPIPASLSDRRSSPSALSSSSTRSPSSPLAGKKSPPAPSDTPERNRLDSSVAPATATSPEGSTNRDQGVAPALLESLASLMPSGAPSPPADSPLPLSAPSESPTSRSAPGVQASGGDDWAALHHKMQNLGVSRYTIEGQPSGQVVFSCLIPLAGRQAVAQHFEAEGENGFQAANAALRRVALWRATQQR